MISDENIDLKKLFEAFRMACLVVDGLVATKKAMEKEEKDE